MNYKSILNTNRNGLSQKLIRGALSVLVIGLLLSSPVFGSTPGCPDCPDWINFDSWWDRYHTSSVHEEPSDPSPKEIREAAQSQEQKNLTNMVYPVSGLLVRAGDGLSKHVILDARSPEEYKRSHISGSRNLYWKSIQSAGVLDPDRAVQELCKLGVNNTDSIVVCGSGDDSAYLFWALEYLGQENLSLLGRNVGSLPNSVLVQVAPVVTESSYTLGIKPWLLVNRSMLDQYRSGVQIIDARPSFTDYGFAHLKNSTNMRIALLYEDPDNRTLKSAGELEQLFDGRGLDKDEIKLVYGTPEACSLYFALRLMGYNATVLDGNWWQDTESVMKSIS
ncbi:MAG: sulfurtransferase [Methanotrichaceae archaeon]